MTTEQILDAVRRLTNGAWRPSNSPPGFTPIPTTQSFVAVDLAALKADLEAAETDVLVKVAAFNLAEEDLKAALATRAVKNKALLDGVVQILLAS